MNDDWITCPRCKAEGEINMEWIGDKFVAGSGEECPLCRGAMGFADEDELRQAETVAFTQQQDEGAVTR